MFKKSALEKGLKVEKEHKRTYQWLETYFKKYGKLPPKIEFYLHIVKDHLLEDGLYYEKLATIENKKDSNSTTP